MVFFASLLDAQSILDKKVSYSCENFLLGKALSDISKTLEIPFSYSNNIIPPEKYISCSLQNVPLRQLLDFVLEGVSVGYKILGPQVVLYKQVTQVNKKFTVSGYIKDEETGEGIVGAVIYNPFLKVGTYTNEFGYYNLTFLSGETELLISSLGYESLRLNIHLFEDLHEEIYLKPAWLEPVLINYFPDSVIIKQSPNTYDININMANRMVSLGGESDLVRTVFTLPGVQTGADGFGGIAVRGGGLDQNLFLLDGVPIYNSMHGIGLFSVYNSSAIRSAKVLKGAFPARYGGRMSSIWDVQTKEGNKKEFLAEVEVGVTTAKLTFEAPLIKDKASFFFSGRRALFDFYSEPINNVIRENKGFVNFNFQDLNMKLNFDLFENDHLFLSYYAGNDTYDDLRVLEWTPPVDSTILTIPEDTTTILKNTELVDWGNQILSLRWNHEYSDKIFGNTTLSYSSYKYGSEDLVDLLTVTPNAIPIDTLNRDVLLQVYSSEIEDFSFKLDFDYAAFDRHKIKFGSQYTAHKFTTKLTSFEEEPTIDEIERDTIGDYLNLPLYTSEFDFYFEDEIELSKRWRTNLGLRVSGSYVLDKILVRPQPRLLFTYEKENDHSFDFSICRMTQFLHLISPSRLGLPKDLWVTASKNIPPQDSWQFTAGFNKKLKQGFSFDIDVYYKKLLNQIFLKGGIDGINAHSWQENVAVGTGKTYGVELLVQKQSKNWSGWLSYTLGWSNRRFPISDEINFGESFPTKLDRRHNLNLQFLYDLNKRWDFALGYIVASGSFYNLPLEEYIIQSFPGLPDVLIKVPIVEGINDLRLRPYHRLDLSANYNVEGKSFDYGFKMGVTNVYGRLNPLFRSIRDRFESDGDVGTEFIDVSLLPIFPSLRYYVKFK